MRCVAEKLVYLDRRGAGKYLKQVHIDIAGPMLRVAAENGRGSGRS